MATKTPAAALACEDCALKSISAKLQLQLKSQPEYAKTFSSLTSSCKKTTFTFTSIVTTTYYIVATGPAPAPPGQTTAPSTPTNQPCVGPSYTIKSTDTCKGISKANSISTEWMLRTNGLAPYCAQFPVAGKTVCIDTAHKCKTYTVKTGDTCGLIGDAVTPPLTWTQVMSWNPELGPGCGNIQTYVGYEICIERPGGNWRDPEPIDEPVTTTSPEPTRTGIPIDTLPQATYTGIGNHSVWIFAEGTRRDCQTYSTGAEMLGNNTCSEVATAFDIRLEDELKLWNPSLETASPCVLNTTEHYCVQVNLRIAANITQQCVMRNYASPGVGLKSFMSSMGVPLEQFAAWNPTVKTDGSGYKTGYEYCMMVEHFKQPGIISTCNQFVKLNSTSANSFDQPCRDIETKFGLSHARFVAWNPAVLSTCQGIVIDYDYCVSIPNFKPVYTTTSSVTVGKRDHTIYTPPTVTPVS